MQEFNFVPTQLIGSLLFSLTRLHNFLILQSLQATKKQSATKKE